VFTTQLPTVRNCNIKSIAIYLWYYIIQTACSMFIFINNFINLLTFSYSKKQNLLAISIFDFRFMFREQLITYMWCHSFKIPLTRPIKYLTSKIRFIWVENTSLVFLIYKHFEVLRHVCNTKIVIGNCVSDLAQLRLQKETFLSGYMFGSKNSRIHYIACIRHRNVTSSREHKVLARAQTCKH